MKPEEQQQRLDAIIAEDPRFKRDAYLFISESVAYAMAKMREQGEVRHIEGQELLEEIREYALERFGPLALDVLQDWGIYSCEDIGDIVFHMVESHLLGASENDSPDDFKNGYDFREAFLQPFMDNHDSPPIPPRIA